MSPRSSLRNTELREWQNSSLTTMVTSWVQTPLKSWNIQASIRNCKNCIHNCKDHSLLFWVQIHISIHVLNFVSQHLGPVVWSLVSANLWLRGIKTYRFPWYLTLVSANHASSNPGLATKQWIDDEEGIFLLLEIVKVKGSKGFVFEVKIIHW